MISSVRRSWNNLFQHYLRACRDFLLLISLTHSAQALIDTNLNGVSDLWEKTYNSGNLFTNFNSLADTDGDGWTNGTEAISGTNPLDQIAPQGIIPLQIIQTPAVYTTGPNGEPQIFTPAAISITWPTLTGKQYTLFTSVDLTPGSWLAIDNDTPRIGTTAPMGNAFSISQTQGNSAPSMFYRLAINDADSDGDTLTNHEEATLATDPFSPDTDLDGFPDNTDPAPLSSATLSDPDGAGLVNAQNIPLSIANGLLGRWNLEDHQIISNPPTGYTPFQYPDSAGANPATSFSVFPHLEGMVSKATNHAGGYLSIPTAVLGTQKIYTTAFWALLEPGSISAANGAPVALFSHHQRIPWLINNVPQWGRYTEQLNGLWFEKSGSQERLRAGTHIYTNHLNGVPTAGTTTSLGINILRDAGTADDGKWHHYTFVHHDATKTLYIDGVLVGTATHTPATISINSIYSGISLGRISGPSPAATGYFQGTSPTRGRMDRLRIWNRPLTPAEATALYREDIDKDDLWDITENNRLWRDNNSDGLQTTTERAFSSSPFTWQATTSDTDDDGLTDVQEQTQGTKIDDPDTDGDLLPDGWEVSYQLNPLIPNDPNDDTDQDALTLLNEYRYNTNPTLANTDGDSQNDSIEVNQGSNPNDNSDGGAPVPPDQQLSVLLGIGDKSGSHSEDYVLNCYRLDPTTGQETRIYTLRSGGYGLYKEETQTIFKKGETYTFQIDWQSSNLDYQSAAPGVSAEGPDYDYTFKVQPQGSNTGILIDAYDPKTKTIGNPILAEDASDVATTEAEFKQNYESKRVNLVAVDLGVDNNRNGTLDLGSGPDQATAAMPYRFWLNNDHDNYGQPDTYNAADDHPWTTQALDNANEKIESERDVEDFARLHLKIERIRPALEAGTMTLGFKWKSVQAGAPKIRLFKAADIDGGTKYLSTIAKAADQVSLGINALGVVEGTTILDLPVSFWTSTASSSTKYFLYEGLGEGKGELSIVIKEGNTVIGEGGSVFLDILDIRKMYEQWSINPLAVIPDPDRDVLLPITGVTAVPDPTAGQTFQPAWDENLTDKNYVICVHGWRKGGPAAANSADFYKGRSDEITMFKRLWHRGFKGRYIGFIWPPYDVTITSGIPGYGAIQSPLQSKFDYSEYRAWKCGEAFKIMVNGLPSGYRKKVFAHSLGNVVVASALEKGMTVDSYALLNAAISARCYHKAAPTPINNSKDDLSDDATAAVRALSYRGDSATVGHARLENVGGKLSNFYLPNDFALSGVGGWEDGQYLKPIKEYEYDNSSSSSVYWDSSGWTNRIVVDPHEAMAMANTSHSKAVGSAPVLAGTGGTGIDTNIDMDGPGMDLEWTSTMNTRLSSNGDAPKHGNSTRYYGMNLTYQEQKHHEI